ncbi:hypothetical protein H8E88_16615 [candidate division KSB1 bacterium]|nr:hypothetical protein [candidate division KSB1 bacterium]
MMMEIKIIMPDGVNGVVYVKRNGKLLKGFVNKPLKRFRACNGRDKRILKAYYNRILRE